MANPRSSESKSREGIVAELKSARMEIMKIRFRKVLGEGAPPHVVRNIRKSVAKLVVSLSVEGKRDV